jgi:tetratricopeptide (TPR) repeat protein
VAFIGDALIVLLDWIVGYGARVCRVGLCAAVLLAPGVWADPTDDARALKDEALTILKANSSKAATPDEYATCILKLEKAQGILEGANESDSSLAQEVSSSLFWARRFSNVEVIKALEKMRGGPVAANRPAAPAKPVAPPAAKPAAKGEPAETPEMLRARAAAKAFGEAQLFAASHRDDEYAVALRWFQMAGEHSGSDEAMKAMELAREAQKRYQYRSNGGTGEHKEPLPEGDEAAEVQRADNLLPNQRFEEAIKIYRESIKRKDDPLTRRRLAKAIYFRAQQIKDLLKPKFEANAQAYRAAWNGAWKQTPAGRFFNGSDPNLVHAKREGAALIKESDVAFRYYQEAEMEFKAILKSAPEGKDFEAAGYIGLCQCVRPFFKNQGQTTLKNFVKEYTPANDFERTLYEFCKAEIERIHKGL